LQRKTPSIEVVRIVDSRIGMFTAMRGTWLYSRYVDNPNKVNNGIHVLVFDMYVNIPNYYLKFNIANNLFLHS